MGVGTDNWTDYWAPYMPAIEAWQAFMVSSMSGFGRASMMWMMAPLEVGRKPNDDQSSDAGDGALGSLIRHAMDAQQRAETFATTAYASTLEAGHRRFREIEAGALDRGTIDPTLVDAGG